MSTPDSPVRSGAHWSAPIVILALGLAAACSGQGERSPIGPSAIGGTQVKPPTAQASAPGTTTVSFDNFDPATLMVTVNTLTASILGQPYIDEGKIHLEILVDDSEEPVPCGTAGAHWMRFDGDGGGLDITDAMTSHVTDLGALGASCGDSICIRAQYVTGGGQTHVDTHFSDPTSYEIVCTDQCTYTQGYWKTHGPSPTGNNENEWPASVLATGLMLGDVSYTAAELQSIFDTPVGGNGLISLAHQLITAKLNIANGADGSAVASAIASADALIGSLVVPPVGGGYLAPAATSSFEGTLASYNEGLIGPGHCGDETAQ